MKQIIYFVYTKDLSKFRNYDHTSKSTPDCDEIWVEADLANIEILYRDGYLNECEYKELMTGEIDVIVFFN